MIQGLLTPDKGGIVVGETVKLAVADQDRQALLDTAAANKNGKEPKEETVFECITGGQEQLSLGSMDVNSRAYCTWFGFRVRRFLLFLQAIFIRNNITVLFNYYLIQGSDQQKRVSVLSGGERNRCQLAKVVKSGANVLILDEPTNDLDVDTIRALEEALLEFAGCVIVVSHDRYFLDRLCTHILAYEGSGQVTFFEGNYQEYATWKTTNGEKDKSLSSSSISSTNAPFAKLAR